MNKKIKFFVKGIIFLLVVICISGLYFYYIVPNPKKTIEQFQNATNALNIDEMLECFEPKVQKQSKALLNITSGIVGGITGLSIDFSDLVEILPLFAGLDVGETPNIKMVVSEIYYSGGIYEKICSSNGINNHVLGTLLAEDADCYVAIYINDELVTEDVFLMKKYGRDGWKITAASIY